MAESGMTPSEAICAQERREEYLLLLVLYDHDAAEKEVEEEEEEEEELMRWAPICWRRRIVMEEKAWKEGRKRK